MAQQKKNKTSSAGKKRRWRIEFGPMGMLGMGLMGTLVMAWAFILGILVGRGYHPESVIPEIGRIVSPQLPVFSPPRTVLEPEELRFHETLQERGSQPAPPAARRSDPPPALGNAQPPRQTELPQEMTPTPPPPVPEPAGPRFEFVYQVASFQTEAQARAVQQQVASVGLQAIVETGMVDSRQWYRVLVTVRGTQSEADQARMRLQGVGVANPFLRTKKSL